MMILIINWIRALKRHADKIRVLSMLICVIIFGSMAFSYFEGTGIWDALYWVTVTITTVGYGDYSPTTMGGRITFVLVALGGIGTIAYVIELLVSLSTRSQLKKLFGFGEEKMKKHTIIVGWNARTEEAIKELNGEDEEFLVVGSRSELDGAELDAMEIPYITGDPTKSETLKRCNIKDAKTIIISLEDDSRVIMIALAVRRMNPDIKIVATSDSREHVEMMKGAGIDYIISHAEMTGRLLAHAVTEPVVVNFIMDASTSIEGFDLKEIKVGKRRRLSEISLKENEKVIALYKSGRFIFNFSDDCMLENEDYLVIAKG